MTHSHEPSYYEIALTNRQVLTVFVVLLLCIVVAFFSGVWVGQQEARGRSPEVAQGVPAETDSAGDQAAVGELRFFSEGPEQGPEPPSLAEMAEEPQTGTTLLEDLGGQPPPVGARPEPASSESPATSGEPAEQVTAGGSTAAEPAPPAMAGEHVVQVFSSSDALQAKRLLRQLSDGGYPAFLSPMEVSGLTMYRVRIGPYRELAQAKAIADRVRRDFRLDTWVTQ